MKREAGKSTIVLLTLGIVILLASLFILRKNGKPRVVTSGDSGQHTEASAAKQPDFEPQFSKNPVSEEPKAANDNVSVTENLSTNEWSKDFSVALSQRMAAHGFTQAAADCLVSTSQANLKAEKPLDFNGISDSCAAKHQITGEQRLTLRAAFRDSTRDSRNTVDLDKWKSCMIAKYKVDSCVSGLIRENVENFYTQKSGSAPTRSDVFESERQTEIEKILNEVLKKCPNNIDELNGVFANECT